MASPVSASVASSAGLRALRVVAVGEAPSSIAIDHATHTAYIANLQDDDVSIVNTQTCNATHRGGCGQIAPTVAVGHQPTDVAIDLATDTVYVVGAGNKEVSVIKGRTCNASVTSGCGLSRSISVGFASGGLAVNQDTNTIYVSNRGPSGHGHTVSVINGATCNGQVSSGCGLTAPTVKVGEGPGTPAVDQTTDTVYVPSRSPSGKGKVSVINGKTCDGTVHSGCHHAPRTVNAGPGGVDVAIDQSTDTVYEPAVPATRSLDRVYVINGARCNASVRVGCGQHPRAITVGAGGTNAVVDRTTQSVFVANSEDNTVSVIDGQTCHAGHLTGCGQHPPTVRAGDQPVSLAVDPLTHTVYAADESDDAVAVLGASACTLTHRTNCRHPAPTTTVANAPTGVAVDNATDTVYAANYDADTVSVINGASCNVAVRTACGHLWPTIAVGSSPTAIVVDQQTHTVYVANDTDSTVSVIDAATCNAHVTTSCGGVQPTVSVGSFPVDLAVNTTTDTVYVVNLFDEDVSAIDGATCNASDHAGCSHSPPTVAAGSGVEGIAVNATTNTVYVSNTFDDTVSAIDGATCDATVTSGCGQIAPVVAVGPGPGFLAVNPVTDTVYVANDYLTFAPHGSVSVIDGATCNASVTSGCGQTVRTLVAGSSLGGIGVDRATGDVYVSSGSRSEVEVFHGATCDATHGTGCGQTPVATATGGGPGGLGLESATHTIFVADRADGQVSFFAAAA